MHERNGERKESILYMHNSDSGVLWTDYARLVRNHMEFSNSSENCTKRLIIIRRFHEKHCRR